MELFSDFEEASKLINEEHVSLEIVDHTVHIALPASYLGKIKHAVGLLLHKNLRLYSSTLQGMPVAFNNRKVKLLSRVGAIIGTQSCVQFDVQTEFIVFKPKIGDILQGKVHKTQQGRIGSLIHGFYYASIICNQQNTLNIGDIVLIKVTQLDDDGNGFLSIIGEYQSTLHHASPIVTQERTNSGSVDFDSGIDDDHILNKSTSSNGNSSPLLFPNAEESTTFNEDDAMSVGLNETDGREKSAKKKKDKKKQKKEKKKSPKKEHKSEKDKSASSKVPIPVEELPEPSCSSEGIEESAFDSTVKQSKTECIPASYREASSELKSWLSNFSDNVVDFKHDEETLIPCNQSFLDLASATTENVTTVGSKSKKELKIEKKNHREEKRKKKEEKTKRLEEKRKKNEEKAKKLEEKLQKRKEKQLRREEKHRKKALKKKNKLEKRLKQEARKKSKLEKKLKKEKKVKKEKKLKKEKKTKSLKVKRDKNKTGNLNSVLESNSDVTFASLVKTLKQEMADPVTVKSKTKKRKLYNNQDLLNDNPSPVHKKIKLEKL